MVVDHAPGITIKADEFGRFYAFDALRGPSAAHDQDGRDLRPWFAASDELIWEPLAPPDRAHGARQEITLTFARPPAATTGFLVARASTGLWGSQMIRQFSQLRGTALADWYYAMPSTGDYGFVSFKAPPVAPGATRTVFVHARGYYRMHLDPTAPPDSATLTRFFSTPDAAALFAAERYAAQRSPATFAH